MISIAIFLVAVVVVGLAFYFRVGVANVMQGLAADVQATWTDFNTLVWPTIRATVFAGLAASLIPWFIFLFIMMGIGAYAKSIPSAFAITIVLPFWFFLFIMPKFIRKNLAIKFIGCVLSIILIAAGLHLSFGVFSPDMKASWDRVSDSTKKSWAYDMNGKSSSSAAEVGVIKAMGEDSCIYNGQNKMMTGSHGNLWKIFKGSKVKVMNPDEKPIFINGSEGMVRVMLMNPGGDFNEGYVVYVPSRKIDWNGNG